MGELTKTTSHAGGFEGFEDRHEGDDRPQGGGVIQGTVVKFTNEAMWMTRDEEELPADLEVIATDIVRVVQKWIDQQPAGPPRILEPGEKFPDLEALNETAPKSEWTEGPDGKPRGPYQVQYIVHLLNPKTMDRYSFATGTVGGGIAVRELRDKVIWMRKLRGEHVYPIVSLTDKFMNTRFGGRQRPHFVIVRWITLGADEKAALPAPAREVKEPTLAEEMRDQIPDSADQGAPWDDALPADLQPPGEPAIEAAAKASETPPPKPAAQKPRITKKGVQKTAAGRGR
ncbi:MAG: hypothetical protein WCB70_02345 [Xanthobacteraceae bacterium]